MRSGRRAPATVPCRNQPDEVSVVTWDEERRRRVLEYRRTHQADGRAIPLNRTEPEPDSEPVAPPARFGWHLDRDDGDTAWMADAACKGQGAERWHPEAKPPERLLATCRLCPVIDQCAAYAIADPTLHGVWGATTAKDRNRIRREMRDAT